MAAPKFLYQLDEILREVGTPKTFSHLKEKYHYADKENINTALVEQLVEKLRDDGNIYVVDNNEYITKKELKDGWYIRRTLEGEMLLLANGYVNAYEKEINQKKIQNLKDGLLIGGTWVAGLSALLLLVWEIYKRFYLSSC